MIQLQDVSLQARVMELEARLADAAKVSQALKHVADIRRREYAAHIASLEKSMEDAMVGMELVRLSNQLLIKHHRRRCLHRALAYRKRFWTQRRTFAAMVSEFRRGGWWWD